MKTIFLFTALILTTSSFASEKVDSFNQISSNSYIYEYAIKSSNSEKLDLMATHTNALYLCLSKGFKTLVEYEKTPTKGKLANIYPNGDISGYNYDSDRPGAPFEKLSKVECRIEFETSNGMTVR